jgi:hypothetical protein
MYLNERLRKYLISIYQDLRKAIPINYFLFIQKMTNYIGRKDKLILITQMKKVNMNLSAELILRKIEDGEIQKKYLDLYEKIK